MLARRYNVDTPSIRLADSMVDTVFYLGVLWALWRRAPGVLLRYWPLLALLLVLEVVRHLYDLLKFGKAASYHSYLAKLWGFVMALSVMGVLAWGRLGGLLVASMILGVCSNLEGLAFSILLPAWHNDVKTLRHALILRRQMIGPPA